MNRKFFRWYVEYGLVNLILLAPAYAVNLGVVALFISLRIQGFWILSSVIVGDVIAYAINHNISVIVQVHWPYLQKLQDRSREILRR